MQEAKISMDAVLSRARSLTFLQGLGIKTLCNYTEDPRSHIYRYTDIVDWDKTSGENEDFLERWNHPAASNPQLEEAVCSNLKLIKVLEM